MKIGRLLFLTVFWLQMDVALLGQSIPLKWTWFLFRIAEGSDILLDVADVPKLHNCAPLWEYCILLATLIFPVVGYFIILQQGDRRLILQELLTGNTGIKCVGICFYSNCIFQPFLATVCQFNFKLFCMSWSHDPYYIVIKRECLQTENRREE